MMTDDQNAKAAPASSARLDEFQAEVSKLKVTGGGANPERLGAQWGIGLTIFGFVVMVIAWWSAHNSGDAVTGLRSIIIGTIGLGISVVGIVIWLRNSITRYLRYWIIRLVYEQREQTEQIVEALRNK
jgi:hypothetical protein